MGTQTDLEGMRKALKWAASGDTGVSSETILAAAMGVTRERGNGHPGDAGDLGRCLRLLRAWPDTFTGIERLAEIDPYWAAILDNWDKLSKLAKREDVVNNNQHDKPSPKTGKLLHDIIFATYRAERRAELEA